METCKSKATQAGLGIFTHIPVYSSIIRHIQKLCMVHSGIPRTVCKPGILRTQGIFRTLSNIHFTVIIFATRLFLQYQLFSISLLYEKS